MISGFRAIALLGILLLGGGLAGGQPPFGAAQAEEFSAPQRAEIVAIMRDAMKRDSSILRDAITALQADEGANERAVARAALDGMRDMLVTPDDPVAGNPKGDVTIVEFFDARCPYCKRMDPVMDQFLKQDRGVKLVYKDLPILVASKAIMAAQRQQGYEKMREAVMKLPSDMPMGKIQAEAEKLGLNWPRLAKDMEDPALQKRIDANLKIAQTLNIQGTPALIIGNDIIPGAIGLDELRKAVAQARKPG
jgi:protein-disulfide isomerase